jgi:hypothetical protein
LYPVKYKDETVLRKIREYFILSFFGEDKTMLQPHEAVDKYIEEYISSYKELESDFEKEIKTTGHKPKAESWYSYYEASFNEIIYNKRDLLSYSVSIEYYTGGTHGGYGYNNFVLDLKTGNRLKEQDIFIPEYQDELSKIIVKALMAQNEVSKTHDLESIGFFNVEEIYPNNNFSIDEEGITYTFNEYEIAPYTIGRTDVFLNFDSVKHLINPESIVFRLIPLQKKNNPSRRDR